MPNTTELHAVPAGASAESGFPPPPPPPPARPVPTPPNQVDQAPMLPQVAAAVPRPATAPTANPFATMSEQWSPNPTPQRPPARKGRGRRGVTWLLVLAVIGGATYAGFTYGSQLMELATGDDSIDEPAAPTVFPTATATPIPVRTATFTVERQDSMRGPQRYEVTSDFDRAISRVVIDRGDAPDLEVLTVFDQAVIRRVDEPTWYRLDRGNFPVDSEFGQARWIRTLDQLIPPSIRGSVTIDRATESTVGTAATHRLLMSVDPATIVQAAQPAAAAAPVDPGAEAIAPPPATPVLPAGVTLQVGTDPVESLVIEAWIDDTGIVRKSIMPPELGGETITITSLSPDEWQPVFPTEDMVQPLTASALFNLGL
ncbi:MAG: hypothetical protein WBL31_04915 [Ilumatobacteraceae bacterium]